MSTIIDVSSAGGGSFAGSEALGNTSFFTEDGTLTSIRLWNFSGSGGDFTIGILDENGVITSKHTLTTTGFGAYSEATGLSIPFVNGGGIIASSANGLRGGPAPVTPTGIYVQAPVSAYNIGESFGTGGSTFGLRGIFTYTAGSAGSGNPSRPAIVTEPAPLIETGASWKQRQDVGEANLTGFALLSESVLDDNNQIITGPDGLADLNASGTRVGKYWDNVAKEIKFVNL